MRRWFFAIRFFRAPVFTIALFVFVALTIFSPTNLRAASPQLDLISPPGAQRGTEVELTFNGRHLDDVKGLLFYSTGLEVLSLAPAEKQPEKQFKAKIKIWSDCALGEHALRVWTATGLSEIGTFYVGPFPTVEEKKPNNDIAHAQPIPLNSTVSGTIKDEAIDYFSVVAKKGQRITAEVEGIRLGREMFDPCLTIFSKDGRKLAENDDNALFLQDPLASIIAPEDGTYFIAVRDSTWGGNDRCVYRLHIGTFPQPLAVYPPGGQIGEKLAVKLVGDVLGAIDETVQLPAQPSEKYALFAEQNGECAPAANTIRVSPFPNVLEIEPNNSVKQATTTDKQLPLAFNGVIGEKGDADFFKFSAKKDQQLDVNVFARRLRSPLDSVLTIYDAATEKQLASNDDADGNPDSYLRFKVPANGEYCVSVRDQLGRGGAAFVYRIEVTIAQPEIALSFPEVVKNTQKRQAVVIPRGNRFATTIRAKRENFDGDFSLNANDLPQGASFVAGPVAGDVVPVVFEAAPDAPLDGKLCGLAAAAQSEKSANDANKPPLRSRYDQAVELIHSNPNNTVYYKIDVDKLAVAVADEAPFHIEIAQPKTPLLQNGSMNLRVIATRNAGFTGAIEIAMLYNPPGVGSQPSVTIPPDKNEATIPLSASANADPRKWKIAVTATDGENANNGKSGAVWVSSQLADLEISPPFVTANIERATVEQGGTTTVVCKLKQSTAFDGEAKLELLGLPNKVTAPELKITASDNEARFTVTADKTSPVGQHKSLFCRLTFSRDGEQVVSTIGQNGMLRIDKPAQLSASAK